MCQETCKNVQGNVIYNSKQNKTMTIKKKKKNLKQPTRPLTGEWINKLWCIHIMEYCIAMKMTKLQLSAPTRMNLKNNVE